MNAAQPQGWRARRRQILAARRAQGRGGNKALRRAIAFLRAYRWEATGAFVALLFVSAGNLIAPQLLRLAIDRGIGEDRWPVVIYAAGGLIVVALLSGLATFLQGYLAERASQGVAYDLRDVLFRHIQRLGFSYYDQTQTGQLITRLTNDVEQIRSFVGNGIVQLLGALVMLTGSTVLLLIINWRLALLSMLTVPAILIVLVNFIRRIGPLFMSLQQALGRLNTVLQEDLTGRRVIRAFAREGFERERYRTANDELLVRNLQAVRMFANNFPLIFLFSSLGTLIVVWFGGRQVIGGQLQIGELIAFNTYLGFLIMPLLSLGFLAMGISRASASANRVFEVLDTPLEVQEQPDAITLPEITGRVEFNDVHFRYAGSEREILGGISFTAEPGQTVAILGTTGSGKSTIVNLIPRFYDVNSGSILIDGHDVRDVTLSSLRSQVGIVLQQSFLFSGSVRDNIAYGRPHASLDEIEAAARAAQADTFIAGLPDGYDTIIGERGLGLSGGQRQRIAIARALLINPRLLILDDSTSAVDAETEAAIQQALDELMQDDRRTVFVIAQRISTVRSANLILVLDEGKIVAQGSHETLLETSELYNEILGSQIMTESDIIAEVADD